MQRLKVINWVIILAVLFILAGCFQSPTTPPPPTGRPETLQLEYQDEDVEIYEEEDAEEEEFELFEEDVKSPGATLSGVVKDQKTKQALPGVEITLTGPQVLKETTTDAHGSYTFENVPPGKYRLLAKKEYYKDYQKTLTLREGKRVRLNFSMLTNLVKGKVTDKKTKKPIEGVIITLLLGGNPVRSTETDSKGAYALSALPPGEYQLKAEKDGYKVFVSPRSFRLSATSAKVVNFKMEQGATLVVPLKPAKWTVLVYMAADNNFAQASEQDLEEMQKVGSTDDVNLLVFWDPGKGKAGYYYVQKGSLRLLQPLGNVNSSSSVTLQRFITFAKTYYPAERYALILWGHGSGWRGRGIAFYDSSTYGGYQVFMSIPDLARALRSAGVRFDLIGFDSCIMGMVEVAYEIRSLGNVMVASETVGYYPGGWNYSFLEKLVENPFSSPEDLARYIIERYRSFWGSHNVALSAIALGQVEHLVRALSAFAQKAVPVSFRDMPQELWVQVDTGSNNPSDGYRFGNLDIGKFADYLKEKGHDTDAQGIQNALAQAVIENYVSGVHKQMGICGLSVFLPHPDHRNVWSWQKPLYKELAFARETQWDEFIERWCSTAW